SLTKIHSQNISFYCSPAEPRRPIQRFLRKFFGFGWIVRLEAKRDLKFKQATNFHEGKQASNMPLLNASHLASFPQLTVTKIPTLKTRCQEKCDQDHGE